MSVWFLHTLAPCWALSVSPCVGLGSEPHFLRRLLQSPTGSGASSFPAFCTSFVSHRCNRLKQADPLLLSKDPQVRPKFLDSGPPCQSPVSYWIYEIPCLA